MFQFYVRFLKKDFFLLFCSCSVSLYHFNFHFEVCHVFLKCKTFGLFGMAAFSHIPLTRKCGKSSCMQIKHFKIRRFPKNSCQKMIFSFSKLYMRKLNACFISFIFEFLNNNLYDNQKDFMFFVQHNFICYFNFTYIDFSLYLFLFLVKLIFSCVLFLC